MKTTVGKLKRLIREVMDSSSTLPSQFNRKQLTQFMTEMGFKSVGGHNFSNGTFNVGPNNGHDALHVRLENGERNQFIWLHCDPNGTWEAKDPTQQVIASGDFMTCVESVKDVNVEFRHDDMGGNFHK